MQYKTYIWSIKTHPSLCHNIPNTVPYSIDTHSYIGRSRSYIIG